MTTAHSPLQTAAINGGHLLFDEGCDLRKALRDGCFRLAIPTTLDVSPGIRLCRDFHRPGRSGPHVVGAYTGFKALDGIYFDRPGFQTEHILADREGRLKYFPAAVVDLVDSMQKLAVVILRSTLEHLRVPAELWDQATGGAVDGGGTQWFAASHYRSERRLPGCATHKDTGFVTVLYIERPGLEALVEDTWIAIDPLPGYFVVNFGGAFELLTEPLPEPVRAILHRVRSCDPEPGYGDRFSFAAFTNPPATGDLYRITSDHIAEPIIDVESFLREFNRTTWNDAYDDFGISGTR